jgi:putative hemolysin
MLLPLLVIVLLTLVNGFLVLAELAIVSSRRARLQLLAAEGRGGADAALRLSEDPARFLSSAQIGITIVAILMGAYGEAKLSPTVGAFFLDLGVSHNVAEPAASGLIIVGVTYLTLVLGELVPKQLALSDPEAFACFAAPFMSWLAMILGPVAHLLRMSSGFIVSALAKPKQNGSDVTEEEVKTLIAEGTEAGVFEKAEQVMIEGVLRVADRSVRAIMVPRPDIVWLDASHPTEEIFKTISESGHTRFPVSRGDVDHIIGIVHAKRLLEQMHQTGSIDLEAAAVRVPLYVHESTNVLKLLDMFKTSIVHMAIVLDEHGTIQGIVTPTDILTGIAGDLPEQEEDTEPYATQREDGSWLIDAQMPVYEVERVLDLRGMGVDDAEYTTLAGFVLSQMGRIPTAGEYFKWKDWRFEVVDLDGRRIDKVMASRVS